MCRPGIIPSGVEMLARILKSCPMEPTNGGSGIRNFLFETAKNKGRVSFDDLEKKMGVQYPLSVFAHIEQVANEKETFALDEIFIARYFGGKPHIDHALELVDKYREEHPDRFQKDNYAEKFLVSHVLMAVKIEGPGRVGFNAVYKYRGIEVHFKNLMPFFGEAPALSQGEVVLCHNSSIILSGVGTELEMELRRIQVENDDFMAALGKISAKGINHREMLSFPWAQKIYEQHI